MSEGTVSCDGCRHSAGRFCLRDKREGREPFTKQYERRFTDSDFCGPHARFFERPVSLFQRMRQRLMEARP